MQVPFGGAGGAATINVTGMIDDALVQEGDVEMMLPLYVPASNPALLAATVILTAVVPLEGVTVSQGWSDLIVAVTVTVAGQLSQIVAVVFALLPATAERDILGTLAPPCPHVVGVTGTTAVVMFENMDSPFVLTAVAT